MGILELLLILFIVLKAVGLIAWSWWAVFIPAYVMVVLYGGYVLGVFAVVVEAVKEAVK